MWRQQFPLLILLLLAVACAQNAATPTVAPTPTPDAAAMLAQAGEAMQALETAHFLVARSGGPAYIDADNTLNIATAEGDFVAPASAQATVKVIGPGLALEVKTIAIGDEQWITNPLTQGWEKLPSGWGFNPAVIFDDEVGWRPLLAENLQEAELFGTEQVDGESYLHLRAVVTGQRVATVTAGAVQSENPVTLDVWLEPDSYRVTRLSFSTPSAGEEPSHWELQFTAFNEPVTIEPPE